jgi:hypothetical protein
MGPNKARCTKAETTRLNVQVTFVMLALLGGRAIGAQQQWSVDATPVLRIAGTTSAGRTVFKFAAGATRLSNGRVVVADGTGGTVQLFDPQGRLVRSVGKRGAGPGEFGFVSWIGQCSSDTSYVWDFMQTRLTTIGPAGDILRQVRLPVDPAVGPPPAMLACSRSGHLAYLARSLDRGVRSPDGKSVRQRGGLYLGTAGGNFTRIASEFPVVELGPSLKGREFPRPAGKLTSIAVGRDRIYLGTADSGFVDALDLAGKRVATIQVKSDQRRPTERHKERSVDAAVAFVEQASRRDSLRAEFLQIKMPDWLPPYSGLFVDPAGVVWVVLSAPGDDTTRLRAFTPTGKKLTDIALPVSLTVFEIGGDYLLGRVEGGTAAPQVALYRLRRPASRVALK